MNNRTRVHQLSLTRPPPTHSSGASDGHQKASVVTQKQQQSSPLYILVSRRTPVVQTAQRPLAAVGRVKAIASSVLRIYVVRCLGWSRYVINPLIVSSSSCTSLLHSHTT